MIVKTANTTEVGKAVGSSSHAVTTLVSHANIRPWAKYKPVLSYRDEGDENWWRGANYKCGFNFTIVSNYTNVEAAYNNIDEWKYDSMAKHPDAPMRLGDFRGYDSEASSPIVRVSASTVVNNGDGDGAGFTLVMSGSSREGELTLADFVDIQDGYFGVYVYKIGGGGDARATCFDKISQGGSLVIINTANFAEGDWRAVPFIALKYPLSQDGSDKDNNYVTIPNAKCSTFTIEGTSANVEASVTALYKPNIGLNPEGGDTLIEVKITILKANAHTILYNNEVQLRKSGITDPMTPLDISNGEQSIKIADWEYEASNTLTHTKIINIKNLSSKMLHGASVIVLLDGTKNVFTTIVMKPMNPNPGGGGGFQPIE